MKKVIIPNVKKECCIICEEEKEQGIHLFGHFICAGCEQEIRLTDPEDEYYRHYLKQLRKIKIPTSG